MLQVLDSPPVIQTQVDDKKTFVIFLDIDGVIYDNGQVSLRQFEMKLKELFPHEKSPYSFDARNLAGTHFFSEETLSVLDTLISKIEEVAKVQIVLSTSWRENKTLEELKTTYFGRFNFSKYIVDKTTETLKTKEAQDYCSDPSHRETNRPTCRAAEIQHWLQLHPEVTNYAILDDRDDHLSTVFKERFFEIHPRRLLTQEIANRVFAFV